MVFSSEAIADREGDISNNVVVDYGVVGDEEEEIGGDIYSSENNSDDDEEISRRMAAVVAEQKALELKRAKSLQKKASKKVNILTIVFFKKKINLYI